MVTYVRIVSGDSMIRTPVNTAIRTIIAKETRDLPASISIAANHNSVWVIIFATRGNRAMEGPIMTTKAWPAAVISLGHWRKIITTTRRDLASKIGMSWRYAGSRRRRGIIIFIIRIGGIRY
jgi:hypothetical protein